jgi:hypothetical protein
VRAIAAVLDELNPLRIGDAAIGELEGPDQLLVARAFVVIGEAVTVVPDSVHAAVKGAERERCGLACRKAGRAFAISWLERFGGEQAQDVGQQQLLMLLFVVDAEFDERLSFSRQAGLE